MRIKICGITNLEDAILCQQLGADALGFIFYKESKRYINSVYVKNIIEHLSPFILKVGVFVNETAENINDIASAIGLNAVQLHGDEKPSLIKNIIFPVIKSFRITEDFDFSVLNKYKDASFLFDSYSEKKYGGTGKTFNWQLIPPNLKDKIILSGGISINNITAVFNTISPAAIDVSSSLEIKPGKKDEKKVREFFQKFNSLRSIKW